MNTPFIIVPDEPQSTADVPMVLGAMSQLPAAITPMDMLDRAVASGAGIDVLTKLMDLHERWENSQARKAFDAAIAAAKAEIPVIYKNRAGHNTRYADFAAIARVVDPVLARHGLSYRFRTVQNGTINVTCILSHPAGHSEENTLSASADKTGAKNDIQAIGSTLTYLQRYSLTQALGLAASEDDDGRAAGLGEKITADDAEALQAKLEATQSDIPKFLALFRIERIEDMPARDLDRATKMLETKAAAKKGTAK